MCMLKYTNYDYDILCYIIDAFAARPRDAARGDLGPGFLAYPRCGHPSFNSGRLRTIMWRDEF